MAVLCETHPAAIESMLENTEADCHASDARGGMAADLVELVGSYAAGEPVDFTHVPIACGHLSTFARRIVRACRRIPYGETVSYGTLAARCGSPGAARAVGRVMASNRYPLVVPCHRVLGAGGRLGGFSAPQGVRMKKRLLDMESGRDLAFAT